MPLNPPTYAPSPNIPFVSFKTVSGRTDWANPDDRRPQHLVDFSVTFLADSVGDWAITLFDPHFNEIEKDLVDNYREGVEFVFGFKDLKSPRHVGHILDYTPDWGVNGTTLRVNGCFEDYTRGISPKNARSWPDPSQGDKAGMKISDIVQKIAEKHGWSYDIEETTDLPAITGNDSTEVQAQCFTQDCGDMEFILRDLASHATASKDGTGSYRVWFDAPNNKLYFKPTRYEANYVETFNYLQNRKSEIISLCPRFGAGLFQTIAAKVESYGIDRTNKNVVKSSGNIGDVGTEQSSDKCVGIAKPTEESLKDSSRATAVVNNVIVSPESSANVAKAVWNSYYDNAFFTVDLSIVGHPDKYAPLKTVRLNVKSSPKTGGKPSLLTGDYLILGVTHTITTSMFQTMLRLSRNSTKDGEQHAPGPEAAAKMLKYKSVLGAGGWTG